MRFAVLRPYTSLLPGKWVFKSIHSSTRYRRHTSSISRCSISNSLLPAVCSTLNRAHFFDSLPLRGTILFSLDEYAADKTEDVHFSTLLQCVRAVVDPLVPSETTVKQIFRLRSQPGQWSGTYHLSSLLGRFIEMAPNLSDEEFIDMMECALLLGFNVTRFLDVTLPELERRMCVQTRNATKTTATSASDHFPDATSQQFHLQSEWLLSKKKRMMLIKAVQMLSQIQHYRNNGKEIFQSTYTTPTCLRVYSAVASAVSVVFRHDPLQGWQLVNALYRAHPSVLIHIPALEERLKQVPERRWEYAEQLSYLMGRRRVDEENPLLVDICTTFTKRFGLESNRSHKAESDSKSLTLALETPLGSVTTAELVSGVQFVLDLAGTATKDDKVENECQDINVSPGLTTLERTIRAQLPFMTDMQCVAFLRLSISLLQLAYQPTFALPEPRLPFRIPFSFSFSLVFRMVQSLTDRMHLYYTAGSSEVPTTHISSATQCNGTVPPELWTGLALCNDADHALIPLKKYIPAGAMATFHRNFLSVCVHGVNEMPFVTQLLSVAELLIRHGFPAAEKSAVYHKVLDACIAEIFDRFKMRRVEPKAYVHFLRFLPKLYIHVDYRQKASQLALLLNGVIHTQPLFVTVLASMVREGSRSIRAFGGNVVDSAITKLFFTLLTYIASVAAQEPLLPVTTNLVIPGPKKQQRGSDASSIDLSFLISDVLFDALTIGAVLAEEGPEDTLDAITGILTSLDLAVPDLSPRMARRATYRFDVTLVTHRLTRCLPRPSRFLNCILAGDVRSQRTQQVFTPTHHPSSGSEKC